MDRDVATAIAAIGDVVTVSHRQPAKAYTPLYERAGRVPHLVSVAGHNHFTEVSHLNTDDRLLGDQIAAFVQTHAPARERSERL